MADKEIRRAFLVFIFLVLVICAGAVELTARMLVPDRVGDAEFHLYENDSLLGWSMKPNIEALIEDAEFSYHVSVNGAGFRDMDRSEADILFIGDSMVWGYGVNYSQRFTSVVADLLGLEVANMGVTGYGAGQSYLNYLENGVQLNASVVVLVLCDNDVYDTPASWRYGRWKPRFFLDGVKVAWDYSGVSLQPEGDKAVVCVACESLMRNIYGISFIKGWVDDWTGKSEVEARSMMLIMRVVEDLDRRVDGDLVVVYIPIKGVVKGQRSVLWDGLDRRCPASRCVSMLQPIVDGGGLDLFWKYDTHLNVEGNRVVGEALAEEVL